MKANNKLKLALIYDWGYGQMLIAEITKPELLAAAKREAVEKAYDELRALARMDPIIAIDKDCELQRVRRILNRLIRERKGCGGN